MKICFAGDVFLGGDLLDKSCSGLVDNNIFKNSDIRVINLEQPISNSHYVADKSTLYTGSVALKKLKELNVDAVNLANNHIQDKGEDAIEETVGHLNKAGVGNFGAGSTILEAQEPYWVNRDIAILGYCEFNKPYLKQVLVADVAKPGVNPLRIEKIRLDLDRMPLGSKAILFFHWGMEHVWLPPVDDIKLVKLLLEDDRVLAIVGTHPHRVQGVVEHAGKKAYMCLGNFVFPNFYIKPPVQIFYPEIDEKKQIKESTRQYHIVFKPTYKKWRWVNRVSLILEFCTEKNEMQHSFVIQDDYSAVVRDLSGLSLFLYKFWLTLLSLTYRLPYSAYLVLWKLHAGQVRFFWRLQIYLVVFRQLGLKKFLNKCLSKISKNVN